MKILIEITGQAEADLVAIAKHESRSVTAQARLMVCEGTKARRVKLALDAMEAEQEEVQP